MVYILNAFKNARQERSQTLDRYSLPRQVNRIMAILLGLGVWGLYAGFSFLAADLDVKLYRELGIGALVIALGACLSIWLTERLLLRFTLDRASFAGAFLLTLIHSLFFGLAYFFHLIEMGQESAAFAAFYGVLILLYFYGFWYIPLALILVYWLIFGCINLYLGGRRDYF